jgi:hypothetical protein
VKLIIYLFSLGVIVWSEAPANTLPILPTDYQYGKCGKAGYGWKLGRGPKDEPIEAARSGKEI